VQDVGLPAAPGTTYSFLAIEPQLSCNRRAGEISICEAGATQIKIAADMREHHDSLIGVTGVTHEQISTNLQGVGVQLALEAGAGQGDLSRDLRADQKYVPESGLVLAAGCRKQIAADFQ